MAYVPPNLEELREKVFRDLRDTATPSVFAEEQVDDFINLGITELNRVRPIESKVVYQGDASLADLPFISVFKVEFAIERDPGQPLVWEPASPADERFGYGRNGWVYFGHELVLWDRHTYGIAQMVENYGAAAVHIAVWGYRERDLLEADDDVAEFESGTDEQLVRKFAQVEGFRALDMDRALFQQWQEQANNSDVSPTQLTNMLQAASGEWDRMRRRIYMIRRTPTG